MKSITIAGNIGKDAQTRSTQQGQTVTSWSVGVNDGWGDNKRTIWFDCSWWGQRGEKTARYLTKGGKVTVSGELGTREYEGKTYLTVNVTDVTLQGGAQDNRGHDRQTPAQTMQAPLDDTFDSDIPFAPEVR